MCKALNVIPQLIPASNCSKAKQWTTKVSVRVVLVAMAAMIAHPVCMRPLTGSVRSSQAAQGRAIQLVVRAAAPKAEGPHSAAKAVRYIVHSKALDCDPPFRP